MNYVLKGKPRFVRAENGVFAGVCKGVANQLEIDAGVVRLLWLISVLFFGTGILLYAFLAFLLPLESKVTEYEQPKLLGLCSRIGANYGHEVALIRMLFVASFLFSGGISLILYLGLYVFIPENHRLKYYR